MRLTGGAAIAPRSASPDEHPPCVLAYLLRVLRFSVFFYSTAKPLLSDITDCHLLHLSMQVVFECSTTNRALGR